RIWVHRVIPTNPGQFLALSSFLHAWSASIIGMDANILNRCGCFAHISAYSSLAIFDISTAGLRSLQSKYSYICGNDRSCNVTPQRSISPKNLFSSHSQMLLMASGRDTVFFNTLVNSGVKAWA